MNESKPAAVATGFPVECPNCCFFELRITEGDFDPLMLWCPECGFALVFGDPPSKMTMDIQTVSWE